MRHFLLWPDQPRKVLGPFTYDARKNLRVLDPLPLITHAIYQYQGRQVLFHFDLLTEILHCDI